MCRVSFVMPSKYNMETLPVPKDGDVKIKGVPGHSAVVHTSFGAPPCESSQVSSMASTICKVLAFICMTMTLLAMT
jgi:hypothetical protein